MYREMTAVIFGDNKAGFGEIRTANQTQCVLPANHRICIILLTGGHCPQPLI